MKNYKVAVILISGLLLASCGVNDQRNADNNDTIYKQSGNTMNRTDRFDLYNENNNNEQFGFVREVKSAVPGERTDQGNQDSLNWEQTARTISRLIVGLPKVQDTSVVVTDQEVLISYKTNDDRNDKTSRTDTADQVKRTAESVVPGWYHIYVTDDPALRQYVENIASLNPTTANKRETVNDTVRMMKDSSPQGHDLNENENPNGVREHNKISK